MTEQEKAFHILQKSFFGLQDELAEYEMAGIKPPKHLLQKFEQTKRRLHIFSKALQKNN
jgi:hypothetical protein